MYPLGHVGIGVHLLPERVRSKLRFRWLALGCLLPDLIDKPWFFWKVATEAGSHPSRVFGHTLAFAALLAVAAAFGRSPALRAVLLGDLTHLFLDVAGELLAGSSSRWIGTLLWPLLGFRFPLEGGERPLLLSEHGIYLAGEAAGAALLLWRFIRRAGSPAGSAAGSERRRRTSP